MSEHEHQGNDILRRLENFLVYPREDLDIELKGWLDLSQNEHKANIAKAILALANHGGGYILIGFILGKSTWVPAELRPSDLNGYTQDIINGIVIRYAEPAFHCEVHSVIHPQIRQRFPVVIVPGNHRVPIRAKRSGPNQRHVVENTYYIRRPGPRSEPIQTAQEWDDLIRRCIRASREDLLESFRSIMLYGSVTPLETISPEQEAKERLVEWIQDSRDRWQHLVDTELSQEQPSRYSNGICIVAYAIVGEFEPPTLSVLLNLLRNVQGRETGWPPWLVFDSTEIGPHPYRGLIECWLKDTSFGDAAHSDYWLASPQGMMFLLRGYEEDSYPNEFTPGTVFDLTLPIWRIGECLRHAERLASALSDQPTTVIFHVTWEGLSGRTLKAWANPRRSLSPWWQSRQDSVTSDIIVPAENISQNLPEIVNILTRPVYESFYFFTPPPEMIQEELTRMRGRPELAS